MKIERLADVREDYARICIYGAGGVGKTTLACSSSYMNTLVFDVDDGMMSLKANPYVAINSKNVYRMKIENKNDFLEGIDYFEKNVKQFQLVVMDTATQFQSIVTEDIIEKAKHIAPEQRDWGQVLSTMEKAIRLFRHKPVNVIWNCHEIEQEDSQTRRRMYRPSFKGAFAHDYFRNFDIVMRYFLVDREVKTTDGISMVTDRWLNCHRDMYNHAKDRSNSLLKYEAPSLDGIMYKVLTALRSGTASPEAQEGA